MILALYYLQSYYKRGMMGSINGMGNFHLHSQFKDASYSLPLVEENHVQPGFKIHYRSKYQHETLANSDSHFDEIVFDEINFDKMHQDLKEESTKNLNQIPVSFIKFSTVATVFDFKKINKWHYYTTVKMVFKCENLEAIHFIAFPTIMY